VVNAADIRADIRAVCWDWNGTLLDDLDICIAVMNEVLITHGEAPFADATVYRSLFRFPLRDFYRDIGIDDDRFEGAVALYLDLLAERADDSRLHANARQTLAEVSSLGIRQVLASATLPDQLEAQMAPHDLKGAFEVVLGIEDPFRASKRDAIARWLSASDLHAEQVLFVGDTNHDFEIAEELGASFLHFAGGHQVHGGRGPSISSLDDLPRLLGAVHVDSR
jgi:phosphoglycolate phosphatase